MRGILLILIALVATPAMAKTPWYAGAGVGATNYRGGSNFAPYDMDEWKAGFDLFGGYQLNEKWAVEVGYIDFGEGEGYSDCARSVTFPVPLCITPGTLSFDSQGLYLNGQYHIPVGQSVSLDLQGGWLFGKAEAQESFPNLFNAGEQPTTKDNDNGAMLGLAFTWHAQSGFGVRGAVNYFVIDYDNVIKKPWRLGVELFYKVE
jgi:hypothetical protein